MAVPENYATSHTASEMLGVTYPTFQKKYSGKIPSIQLHRRGPRLYLISDIKKAYMEWS